MKYNIDVTGGEVPTLTHTDIDYTVPKQSDLMFYGSQVASQLGSQSVVAANIYVDTATGAYRDNLITSVSSASTIFFGSPSHVNGTT